MSGLRHPTSSPSQVSWQGLCLRSPTDQQWAWLLSNATFFFFLDVVYDVIQCLSVCLSLLNMMCRSLNKFMLHSSYHKATYDFKHEQLGASQVRPLTLSTSTSSTKVGVGLGSRTNTRNFAPQAPCLTVTVIRIVFFR